MEIRLSRTTAKAIGVNKFKAWVNNEESWSWATEKYINLAELNAADIAKLEKIFLDHPDVTGTKVLLKDIATWRAALTSGDKAKPRAVRNFRPLLMRVLGKVAGHRVYEKFDSDKNLWLAYYVNDIEYHPERKQRDGDTYPAFVSMDLIWEEFGGKRQKTLSFYAADCIGISVLEALARKGLYIENEELRTNYLAQAKRFGEEVMNIGKQFRAVGTATDDMDGNPGREDSWYWRHTNKVNLDLHGEPSRVVVDVFVEDEKDDEDRRRGREVRVSEYFWFSTENRAYAKAQLDADEDLEEAEIADELNIEKPEIEVPIHPMMAIFDLKRHLRMRIHISYLTEYVYDTNIAQKLIIPEEQKSLVKMLINHKSNVFTDIVAGKAGGAVVLLTGKPGVGKTLTAEVYAESEQRALYSVQCSQLGTDPEELEEELLKVFTRAKRWNAVMLLDEADVYVHARGNDMQQNAIVGVFLRVLEYQSTVLFLTTNRPDDVDDAIASRCIARLSYQVPNMQDQARIWEVLAAASGIELNKGVIQDIVKRNEGLSGRDVKNLLKLARLLVGPKGTIKPSDVEFAKQFKPTS
jgi:hypothetical protein